VNIRQKICRGAERPIQRSFWLRTGWTRSATVYTKSIDQVLHKGA
jgi:hypothetical protein